MCTFNNLTEGLNSLMFEVRESQLFASPRQPASVLDPDGAVRSCLNA